MAFGHVQSSKTLPFDRLNATPKLKKIISSKSHKLSLTRRNTNFSNSPVVLNMIRFKIVTLPVIGFLQVPLDRSFLETIQEHEQTVHWFSQRITPDGFNSILPGIQRYMTSEHIDRFLSRFIRIDNPFDPSRFEALSAKQTKCLLW